MKITPATVADKAAWDDYVIQHPQGRPYHRWAWREAVSAAYGHGATYLVARSDERISGVLPLVNFKCPGRGMVLTSLPYCDVGGPLTDTAEVEAELLQAAQSELFRLRATSLELRMLAPTGGELQSSGKVLMLLDLPPDSVQLLAGLKAKLRSQINKPLRDGLHHRLGGIELLDDFYAVFSRNMRDLGSPVHSREWMRQVLIAYGAEARIGVVYLPDGEPVAAGVILLHDRKISIPWASALRSHNRLNANMLLYWLFLSFGADHGFHTFDFGRSTPGEGTYRFKEQWGAQPSPLQWITIGRDGDQSQGISTPGRLRKSVEYLWRKTPLSVCNTLGPKIRRYLSL